MNIIWRVSVELVPYAARLFLGSCMPSKFNVLPTGEGEAHFNYKLTDCKFRRLVIYILYLSQIPMSPLCLSNLFFRRWKENISSIRMKWLTDHMQSPNQQVLCIPLSVFIKGRVSLGVKSVGFFFKVKYELRTHYDISDLKDGFPLFWILDQVFLRARVRWISTWPFSMVRFYIGK